jgi:hypothetical protein
VKPDGYDVKHSLCVVQGIHEVVIADKDTSEILRALCFQESVGLRNSNAGLDSAREIMDRYFFVPYGDWFVGFSEMLF